MSDKNNDQAEDVSHIKFPCKFVIKIMGKKDDTFEANVIAILKKHFPDFDESTIKKMPSKGDKFVSLSASVFAENKAQLDAAYQALHDCDDVLMTL